MTGARAVRNGRRKPMRLLLECLDLEEPEHLRVG